MQNAPNQLSVRDYVLLACFCIALFGCTLVCGGVLTGHESVLPENTREMLANHDWLVPRIGGEPWLERPPLPDWIMAGIDAVCGRSDSDRVVRIGPILMTTCVVLLASWMAGRWYGRATGLLSGLILATMWEIFYFASDPEADMFLCAIVTAALAFFARVELMADWKSAAEPVGMFARRSWPVLAFFVFLGLTNLAKGLIFGTLMVLVPVASFLLWNHDLARIRRYVSFWGLLIFLGISLAWPVAMYFSHPEIMELWKIHYLGRLYGGYIGEPVWYYLVQLPIVILPWTLPAFVGLWLTRSDALGQRYNPARFLWCWALITPLFFSIPNGKHHHYLLHCLPAWSMLGALGAVRTWQAILRGPTWLRRPGLCVLLIGLPIDLAIVLFRQRIPGPTWVAPGFMALALVLPFGGCWALSRSSGRLALGTLLTLMVGFYWLAWMYQTRCLDRYGDDRAFLQEVRGYVPADRPLFVAYDERAELETFWVLFYSRPGGILLAKPADLEKQEQKYNEIYVLGRAYDGPKYTQYGETDALLQSRYTRFESSPAERRTLFRVRFDAGKVGLLQGFQHPLEGNPAVRLPEQSGHFLPVRLSVDSQ
jgi:4-amino-4-deoxy-L-arabinose transferase-like glycosyltransferase